VDEFLSYYTDELAFLRAMGAEFAAKYPKVAGRLLLGPDDCEDPHVERLLEGFAFLAARVRRKIDDEFPEITDAFFQVLYPHYQRPVPSMSVVQLQPGPDRSRLGEGYSVDRGTRLVSAEVGGVRCAYQTAYPVTLWPVEVASARLQPDCVGVSGAPGNAAAVVRVRLRSPDESFPFGRLLMADRPFQLRFYLDGAAGSVHGMYESLFNHLCGVGVRDASDGANDVASDPRGSPSIRAVGFEPGEGMFPYPPYSAPGYRLLQEYFAFPEKFLFVDLVDWGRAGRDLGSEVEILFFLDKVPPPAVRVHAETFRLGCTPVVNLVSVLAEPIRLDHTRAEYRIVPDVDRPWAYEVYSVDSVASVGGYLGGSIGYEPLYSLRHTTGEADRPAYWTASRRYPEGGGDGGTEVYLTFVSADFRPHLPEAEAVSVGLTCTNRDLPSRLAFGGNQGNFELLAHGAVGRVARCLRKPTPTLRPRTGRGAHWRLVSHLALNHLPLTEAGRGAESLREILRLYDLADDPVSRQQIDGVRAVSGRPVPGRVGPGACLGTEVTVEFDADRYVGGGVFLFASVLERFFGSLATINSFHRLVARTSREGLLKRWPPRAGDRALL
jgi:type VI secretion system protein ImpG